MSLTKVSYSMVQGAAHNVLDFGADPTGVASSVAAFNSALLLGGNVYVPSGTYDLDGQVVISTNNTTLLLAADVTLLVSNVAAVDAPVFGAQIFISGQDCAIIGSGPSSLIQAHNGTYATAIFLTQNYGAALIKNLALDGAKEETTATEFDAFGNGILIAGWDTKSPQKVTIDQCIIRNWSQYGIDNYNNLGATTVTNCTIHDNGVEAQAFSVGVGIINSNGCNDFTAINNVIFNNKLDGISSNSALNASNYIISDNVIYNNTNGSGIIFTQQANYGCVVGQGISYCTVTGNTCTGNGDNGIVFNADIGFLSDITITGNVCRTNGTFGIRAVCADDINFVRNVAITGNVTEDNASGGIFIGDEVINWASSGNIDNTVSQSTTGVFIPVISGSTTAGVGTYVSRSGSYSLINNVVYFQLECDWSAHTGSGNILISGFPYAAKNSEPQPVGWVFTNNLTITGQATFGLIGNTTSGPLGAVNNGAYSAVALDTSAIIRINGFYFI